MSFRRRVVPSAVNSPVVSKVYNTEYLGHEETQGFLDEFIGQCDELETAALDKKYHGPDSTTVSQLKRLQRELRGLPPLLIEGQTKEKPDAAKKTVFDQPDQSITPKKIVFDDESGSAKKPKKIVFD
ncbi:hypothetical protein OGAPHI_007111 [Ogataea philodendri]|uniref:Uncharacterized protein n=1 Tax=Ogataea philodendri TaxID=1378263 RepID=A0A9P8NVL6_9ASCO|nr:uncharacterized protein OGAPHI_007111 [Ogataea philodendri]KAH3660525.1 hypothetical protein OGAPHI_007111 [Ogataea philodendri]